VKVNWHLAVKGGGRAGDQGAPGRGAIGEGDVSAMRQVAL